MCKRRVGSLTPDHEKSRIDPTLVCAGGNATHRWKAFKESYKFASNLVPIEGLSNEL
jgi:hypothetical protein